MKYYLIFALGLLLVSPTLRAEDAQKEVPCSLTIYVKSARNHKPLAGAELKIALWHRYRNSKSPKWKPAWPKERYYHTDKNGKIILDSNTPIPKGGYQIPYDISKNKEFMFAMTATSTGHIKAQQKAYMKRESPDPVSTFYLPVYNGN